MSFINWDHETPEQRAFRRKLEEQALIQQAMAKKLFEARGGVSSASAAASAAGSGALIFPSAILENGKCTLFVTYDSGLGDMVFRVANYDELTLSDATPTGIGANVDNFYFEIIDGKGFLLSFEIADDDARFLFIDAGGNLIKTVHLDYATEWNTDSLGGNAVTLTYYNKNGVDVTFHWWAGGVIGTKKLNNPGWLWTGQFDYDTFADGTINLYDGNNNVYLARPDGKFINITSKFSDLPDWSDRMSAAHNYTMIRNYDGVKYDKLRAIASDGTILGDWDISSYSVNNTNTNAYGSGKIMMIGIPDNSSLSYMIAHFDGATMTFEEVGPKSTYLNQTILSNQIGGFTSYVQSESGAETAVALFYGNSTFDEKMNRYENFAIFYAMDGVEGLQSRTFLTGSGQTFGFRLIYSDNSKIPTYLIQEVGNTNPALMFLQPTGIEFSSLPMAYADLGGIDIDIQAVDQYTMVIWEDAKLSPNVYQFNMYNGAIKLDTVSLASFGDYWSNRNTFIINDPDGNMTYYWNNESETFSEYESAIDNVYYADTDYAENASYATQWDSIDNMYSGTTYIEFTDGTRAILTSNDFSVITEPDYEYRYIGKDRVYFLYRDGGNWKIDIYTESGTLFQSVNTGLPTYSSFYIVSDRVVFRSGSTVLVIHPYSTGGNIAFNVDTLNINWYANDYAKWYWC